MENQNKMCEVVCDLLPLYVEGDCSQSSREMVEQHVESCPDCQKLLTAMKTPLKEESSPKTPKEVTVERALKKVRGSIWKRVLAAALIVALVVLGLEQGMQDRQNGITSDNAQAVADMETVLTAWQDQGAAAAVELLDPSIDYQREFLEGAAGSNEYIAQEQLEYWRSAGEDAFVTQWREALSDVLSANEAAGSRLEEFRLLNISQESDLNSGVWYAMWQTTFSDGKQGSIVFHWEDDKTSLFWAGDAPQAETFFREIRRVVLEYQF